MSSRRTLILVGAIAVGAIAALLILRYVSGIEDKANRDNQLVPVVIVMGGVAQGEQADAAIADGRLVLGERRSIDIPANAVTRLDDVKGQVAAIDLTEEEIVTTSKFAGKTGNSNSNSNSLSEGMTAVTLSFDSVKGVAGLVNPGDYVNILATTKPLPAGDGRPEPLDPEAPGATYVLQKVKVLAIGTNLGGPVAADPEGGEAAAPVSSDLVTFEVPPEVSPTLVAWSTKELYLSLVRPDYQPRPVDSVMYDPLTTPPGELGSTPYDGLPAGAAASAGVGR